MTAPATDDAPLTVFTIELVLDPDHGGPLPSPSEVTSLVRDRLVDDSGYISSPDGWRIHAVVTGPSRVTT